MKTGTLTDSPDELIRRLRERQIDTQYVREYFIPYQMSQERQEYVKTRLQDARLKELNRDFKPVGYYYDTVLWATTFSKPFKSLFMAVSQIKPSHIFIFILACFTGLGFYVWRKEKTDNQVLISVFTIGFTEISLEVIILLGFQILYGYMYAILSIIIAGYMVGLTLGSMNAIKILEKGTGVSSVFRRFQYLMALYPIFIAGLFVFLHQQSLSGQSHQWAILIFPFLSAGAGYIGGMQFPIANRLVLSSGRHLTHVAGFLYGFDLLGSAVGAILTSAFLIPIFGVYPVLVFFGFINFACWLLLQIKKDRIKLSGL